MLFSLFTGTVVACFNTDSTFWVPGSTIKYPKFPQRVNPSMRAALNDSPFVVELQIKELSTNLSRVYRSYKIVNSRHNDKILEGCLEGKRREGHAKESGLFVLKFEQRLTRQTNMGLARLFMISGRSKAPTRVTTFLISLPPAMKDALVGKKVAFRPEHP